MQQLRQEIETALIGLFIVAAVFVVSFAVYQAANVNMEDQILIHHRATISKAA